MDYEQLYSGLQIIEKEMRDKLSSLQKTQKSLAKASEKGDLKSAAKDLAQMSLLIRDCGELAAEYAKQTEGFDAKEYMENGDFAAQMTECCENLSVDIKGEYPIYEIFPYRVRIDSENEELYIDRKKLPCVRPLYFAKTVKQNQDKLNKAPFNASAFLNELADAYDTANLHKQKNGKSSKRENDVLLKDLYGYIVPMQRFRREYDMQSYAFDLSRLFSSDVELTKDGRGFEFGSSRQAGKLIRILDKNGRERLLGTIRFFE
ncbi:MAG: hypothetical protein LBR76_05895 [Oscillospiraceae bacterium]|jgi:hypothetical protein|nr:hypothetical protein [Oscillospiraceae bacterium]